MTLCSYHVARHCFSCLKSRITSTCLIRHKHASLTFSSSPCSIISNCHHLLDAGALMWFDNCVDHNLRLLLSFSLLRPYYIFFVIIRSLEHMYIVQSINRSINKQIKVIHLYLKIGSSLFDSTSPFSPPLFSFFDCSFRLTLLWLEYSI